MNKYMLKVLVILLDKATPTTTISLPLTTFIAVSAYQSMAVTQMKIDNNPFAKAFKYQDNKALIMPKTLLQAMPPALTLACATSNHLAINKGFPPVAVQPRLYSVSPAVRPHPHQLPILGTVIHMVRHSIWLCWWALHRTCKYLP